jgi:hypothetical protein
MSEPVAKDAERVRKPKLPKKRILRKQKRKGVKS